MAEEVDHKEMDRETTGQREVEDFSKEHGGSMKQEKQRRALINIYRFRILLHSSDFLAVCNITKNLKHKRIIEDRTKVAMYAHAHTKKTATKLATSHWCTP